MASGGRKTYTGRGMEASAVGEVLRERGMYTGRGNPYGFELPGGEARIECGGGIACMAGKWTIVDIKSGKALSEPFANKTELRYALTVWFRKGA